MGRQLVGVGGSGAQSAKRHGAGEAAAATWAAAAAGVSGDLAKVKVEMARRVRIKNQGGHERGPVCPRRDTSEATAAGRSDAGDGVNGEGKGINVRCNGTYPRKEREGSVKKMAVNCEKKVVLTDVCGKAQSFETRLTC